MNNPSMNNSSPQTNNDNLTRTLIIAIAVVLLILGGFYIWTNRPQTAEQISASVPIDRAAPPVTEMPSVQDTSGPAPVEQAPALVNKPLRPIVPAPATLEVSDAQVKLAIADIAPAMAEWLKADQQIRKWVLAIDLMADGEVPKSYRPLSFPMPRFEPEIRGVEPEVQYFMKPEGFSRTDLLVIVFTAIDAEHLVHYYQAWLPILDKAYQEQGKKDKFDQRFRMALQRVIDVKPLTVTPALAKRGGVIYTYADSKLEAATDVEKMMWRMGSDNSLKIQNYLKRVMQQLPK